MTRKYHPSEACASHCRKCHLHFASDAAFDAHLGGPSMNWEHHDPRDVEVLRIRTEDGMCNNSREREVEITLWEHGPSVDKTRARKQSGKLAKKT